MRHNPLPPPEEEWRDYPKRLHDVPRPREASYPLPVPDLRQRHPELDKLLEDVIRAVGRRKLPPIVTDVDRLRLLVMLYRFLYSPEWPDLREPPHGT